MEEAFAFVEVSDRICEIDLFSANGLPDTICPASWFLSTAFWLCASKVCCLVVSNRLAMGWLPSDEDWVSGRMS